MRENDHESLLRAREARNPSLDTDQRIVYYACALRAHQVYNRDAKTGKFVLPLRTIKMRKMCQLQQLVTGDANSSVTFDDVVTTVCHMGSKKIKTQGLSNMCFFFART